MQKKWSIPTCSEGYPGIFLIVKEMFTVNLYLNKQLDAKSYCETLKRLEKWLKAIIVKRPGRLSNGVVFLRYSSFSSWVNKVIEKIQVGSMVSSSLQLRPRTMTDQRTWLVLSSETWEGSMLLMINNNEELKDAVLKWLKLIEWNIYESGIRKLVMRNKKIFRKTCWLYWKENWISFYWLLFIDFLFIELFVTTLQFR